MCNIQSSNVSQFFRTISCEALVVVVNGADWSFTSMERICPMTAKKSTRRGILVSTYHSKNEETPRRVRGKPIEGKEPTRAVHEARTEIIDDYNVWESRPS